MATRATNDISAPSDAINVSPSDSADLSLGVCRGLIIGTGGALKVTMASGRTLTMPAVPAGQIVLQVSRIWLTGTDAANIVALY